MTKATNTETQEQYATLRCQAANGTNAVAAAIAMGTARMMGLALQPAKSPKDVIQALVAPLGREKFNRHGQAKTKLEGLKSMDRYAAIQSIETHAGIDLIVAATAEQFEQFLRELERSGIAFESQVLAQIAKAIEATGRKNDIYLTGNFNSAGSWLKATAGQKIQKVLLSDNSQATVARLSLDALYVTAFVENAFLVVDRLNATRGEGSNWAVKPFDLGVLLNITPLADDGYLTATYEDEEGVRQAIRVNPFTPNDDLQYAGESFNTHGGIVMRDDPNEAFVLQYDAQGENSNEIARAFLYTAENDTRRNQQAPGTTDRVFNPGAGGK